MSTQYKQVLETVRTLINQLEELPFAERSKIIVYLIRQLENRFK